MHNLDLSVVVLTYNAKEITDECFARLKKAVKYSERTLQNKLEIIAVDNASPEGTARMIEEKHPWVKLIKSETNAGFSIGNNIGLRRTTQPYILIMNPDALIEEDTLVKALKYFRDHPDCDVLGCQLKFGDGRIQPSWGYLPNPLNTILWILGLSLIPPFKQLVGPIHPKGKSYFGKEKRAEWVMGAFIMMKREVYEKTGGFDETIFMYMEEVELCKRIGDFGFKIWYVPSIKITHLDKASSGFNIQKPLANELKGLGSYFRRHYPGVFLFIKPFIYLGLLLRIFSFGLLGNSVRRDAYLEALGAI